MEDEGDASVKLSTSRGVDEFLTPELDRGLARGCDSLRLALPHSDF